MPEKKKDQGYAPWIVNNIMLIVIFIIIIGCLLYCFTGCSDFNRKLGIKDDHIGEEFLEQQIENQIGLDIDLTPNSPEVA